MKSILYCTLDYTGYKNKIDGQIKEFSNQNFEITIITYDYNRKEYLLLEYHIGYYIKTLLWKKKWDYKFFCSLAQKIVLEVNPDIVYIRRMGASIVFWGNFFKKHSGVEFQLVYEIPTYPIEIIGPLQIRLLRIMEKVYTRLFIVPYAKCIPVFCSIQNVRLFPNMIYSHNCVDFQKYEKINTYSWPEYDRKEIRLLGIAHYQLWHGYDRLIKAMERYKGETLIIFSIYGNITNYTQDLIDYVTDNQIKNVEFYEEDDVDDYLEFVSNYHIAIGCLAIHRKDNKKYNRTTYLDTSIKNKEYCALGIPFIHASNDESFKENFLYHKLVPDDETDISLDEILDWYNEIRKKYSGRCEMYNYAKKWLGYDKYVEKIVKSIYKDSNDNNIMN